MCELQYAFANLSWFLGQKSEIFKIETNYFLSCLVDILYAWINVIGTTFEIIKQNFSTNSLLNTRKKDYRI